MNVLVENKSAAASREDASRFPLDDFRHTTGADTAPSRITGICHPPPVGG